MDKTEKTKINGKKTAKIAAVCVIAVIIAVYAVCGIYVSKNGDKITTEIAIADTAEKTVDVKMFIVRDEKIISASGANIVSAVKDGTRVSANDTVAYSFSDPESAGKLIRMSQISEQLDYYSSLISQSTSVASDTSSYDKKITDNTTAFASLVSSGNFTSLENTKDKLRDAVTSKQTATGIKLDLSETVNALQSEYSSLASAVSGYSEIKSGGAGYYISGTDGYEGVLDYASVDEWTISDAEKAFDAVPSVKQGDIGRIVHGYYWYLVCVADTADINSLKEGARKTVSLPDSSVGDFTAQVYSIRSDRATGKSLVIFRCILMNEDFASLRIENAKIGIESYEGYRVNNKAIRVNEDNETGVYVVKGGVMTFKKVKIEYSNDEYSIVSNPYKDDASKKRSYINLYDEYIIDGKNLKEDKIIK